MQAVDLDHYYLYGDVYETLDTCQELEQLLGRLRRQHILTEQDFAHSKEKIAEIRAQLEATLTHAA